MTKSIDCTPGGLVDWRKFLAFNYLILFLSESRSLTEKEIVNDFSFLSPFFPPGKLKPSSSNNRIAQQFNGSTNFDRRREREKK